MFQDTDRVVIGVLVRQEKRLLGGKGGKKGCDCMLPACQISWWWKPRLSQMQSFEECALCWAKKSTLEVVWIL